MKIYLTIFLSFLLLPLVTLAANTDVTISASQIISVGGYSLTVDSNANFDSITVNASNFSMVMSEGSRLKVTSSDRVKFTVSPTESITAMGCTSDSSSVTLGNNTGDASVTVTVTPSGTCNIGSSGGGGGGGGGGGVPTPVYTVIPGTETVAVAVPTVTTLTPTAVTISAAFTSTMKVGMSGADVKRLQQLLNSDPDTQVSASGVGSAGNETEYFGSLTRVAVKKFQAKHGIVSSGDEETTGYGLVGPATRTKLAEVFVKGVAAPVAAPAVPTATGISAVFTSGMSKGVSNSHIKRLQQLLNSDPDTQVSASGVGSAGNETEYFGSLTEKAVQKFQMKHGVVSSASDAGYGYVGPKTRAKLQEIFGETSVIPTTPATPATPATPSTSAEDQLTVQIQQLLEQVQALQAELDAM